MTIDRPRLALKTPTDINEGPTMKNNIARLDTRIDAQSARVNALDDVVLKNLDRLDRLDARLDDFDERLNSVSDSLQRLDDRLADVDDRHTGAIDELQDNDGDDLRRPPLGFRLALMPSGETLRIGDRVAHIDDGVGGTVEWIGESRSGWHTDGLVRVKVVWDDGQVTDDTPTDLTRQVDWASRGDTDAGADCAQDEFERRHDRKQPDTVGKLDPEIEQLLNDELAIERGNFVDELREANDIIEQMTADEASYVDEIEGLKAAVKFLQEKAKKASGDV